MSICAWSDDYCSDFPEIDEHHKTLFRMINSFAEENDENASNQAIVTFLNNLISYCEKHFQFEEHLMRKYKFPLRQYHEDIHKDLYKIAVMIKRQVKEKKIENPFANIISFSTDWLNNHIAREDITFFHYCKNMNNDLNQSLINRKCDILTMNNKFLGVGKIQSLEKNEVTLTNLSDSIVPLNMNDMVKISLYSKTNEYQVFIAKVFYSGDEIIKLLNATIIKTVNQRKCIRTPVKLDAMVTLGDKAFPVSIDDISASGLMIESDCVFKPGEIILVTFAAQNNTFTEYAKVVRIIKRFGSRNTYGVHFTNISNSNSDKLQSFVFNKQVLDKKYSQTSS